MTTSTPPKAFIWRRIHSIAGLWLVIFIIQHLLVNSQAALLIGHDGKGFIKSANALESIPFLPFAEVMLLGVPILIHLIWGIQYLRTARYNSFSTDGSSPSLPEYSRNRAYTWQRVTAWVLVIGIIAHVVHMRFIERPVSAEKDGKESYMVRLNLDEGLYTLADRLNFVFYNGQQVQEFKQVSQSNIPDDDSESIINNLLIEQKNRQSEAWLKALEKWPLKDDQVMAVANDFGTAELLMVRDTFKKPVMLVLYTLLVLFTCYHAFNGLWTFMIKWGITLTPQSQKLFLVISNGLLVIVSFLGLAAVWGTYWINLKH